MDTVGRTSNTAKDKRDEILAILQNVNVEDAQDALALATSSLCIFNKEQAKNIKFDIQVVNDFYARPTI